jgi:acyl-CoA thioester hydrolase
VEIRSRIVEFGEKTIRFMHEMVNMNTGVVSARTPILGVHFDTAIRKSLPFPDEMRERAKKLMAADPPANVEGV